MNYQSKPPVVLEPSSFEAHTRKLEQEIFGTLSSKPDIIKPPEPARISSPFNAFSLRGTAAEFEDRATDAKPLLGDVCMSGQATIFYAQPNSGKTLVTLHLLVEAVKAGRIDADRAYYLNADDSSRGFAEKLNIADQLGIHTLSPGFKGFKAPDLLGLLRKAATQDSARGSLVVIDTLKKFTSLMKKDESSETPVVSS